MDVSLIPLARAKERLMRIDEQHGVAGGALRGSDGPHVRALLLSGIADLFVLDSGLSEQEQIIERVTSESQRVPRLEMRNQARLHLGVAVQIKIEAVGQSFE